MTQYFIWSEDESGVAWWKCVVYATWPSCARRGREHMAHCTCLA